MKRFLIMCAYARKQWSQDNPKGDYSHTPRSNRRRYFLDQFYERLYAKLPLWQNVSR